MKNVIAGLEEGLQAIAEALEGDSIVPTPTAADEGKVLTANDDGTASWATAGGGSDIPTPTLSDEGKILRVVPQSQETVAPEWSESREVPVGGSTGQILTKNANGFGWASPSGQVPSGGSSGDVLTKTSASTYGWVTPSSGTTLYTFKKTISSSDWESDGVAHYGAVFDISRPVTNFMSIMAYAYLDGWNTPITILGFALDGKSSSLNILISDTDYNKLSSNSATLYVRIVCD